MVNADIADSAGTGVRRSGKRGLPADLPIEKSEMLGTAESGSVIDALDNLIDH
jgi:hypothetical protein